MHVVKNEIIALKLLLVLPSIKSGGGNRVFIELATQFASKFYKVAILYPNNSHEVSHYQLSDKVEMIKIGDYAENLKGKLGNLKRMFKYIKDFNKNNTDGIVLISDPILCILLIFFNNKIGNNIIRFVQADDYRIYDDLLLLKNRLVLNIYKWLCVLCYKKFNIYIFNSDFTHNQFEKVLKKIVPKKIVHPGINEKIFFAHKNKSTGSLNICIVARKHPWKGFIDFIRAWELLNTDLKNQINKVTVISHDDLSSFNMPQKFELIKPDSDKQIARVMNESHIFISTSWWEGFGLPPLEAMACGCAVLASDSKGILEYAIDQQNCLIFEPKNFEELSRKLALLIQDQNLRQNISAKAIVDAQQFTWQNAAEQFISYVKANYIIPNA